MREPIEIKVYWDESDPHAIGYAFKVYHNDGHEESGPVEDEGSLDELVVDVAYSHGLEIGTGDVAVDRQDDCAIWTHPAAANTGG